MTYSVSNDEFAGFGPSNADNENKLGEKMMAEAMKILENPKLHNPVLRKRPVAKVVSRTYDLSDPDSRERYENDCALLLNGDPGKRLLIDRPPKQFVQIGDTYKYVAYLEWIEYSEARKKKKKTAGNK